MSVYVGLKEETLRKIKQKVNNTTVWAKFADPIVYCTKSKRLRNSCLITFLNMDSSFCITNLIIIITCMDAMAENYKDLGFFVLLSLCCCFVFFYTCMLFLLTSTWGPIHPFMPETVTNFVDILQQLAWIYMHNAFFFL